MQMQIEFLPLRCPNDHWRGKAAPLQAGEHPPGRHPPGRQPGGRGRPLGGHTRFMGPEGAAVQKEGAKTGPMWQPLHQTGRRLPNFCLPRVKTAKLSHWGAS